MLGAFFLILLIGMGILFRLAWGDGELGSFKHDQLGAYENFSAAAPLVMRVVTATVDPPVDPARPWDRFKSISVTVTVPEGLSTAAKRLEAITSSTCGILAGAASAQTSRRNASP